MKVTVCARAQNQMAIDAHRPGDVEWVSDDVSAARDNARDFVFSLKRLVELIDEAHAQPAQTGRDSDAILAATRVHDDIRRAQGRRP